MENKHPYIGKYNGMIGLLTSKGYGICLSIQSSKYGEWVQESKLKNITADYLRNTKIRIESPGHSEFVQKLVFGAGGKWIGYQDQKIRFLEMPCLFIDKELNISFFDDRAEYLFNTHDNKEIKLPMPPSQLPEVSSETPMPKVKPPKGSGLNLNPNCVLNPIHDGLNNCKVNEWPKVGDVAVLVNEHNRKVRHGFEAINQKVKVMALFKDNDVDMAVIKYDITNYCFRADMLIKPPTHQEKLTNEIYNQIGSKDDSYALAKAILAGEIEGLVYKGD